MKNIVYFLLYSLLIEVAFTQSINDIFPKSKMQKDLQLFKDIRVKANSGLYKYRTKVQIDSIYHWAHTEIEKSNTYLDFYNIICQLTDFEGSLHNDTSLPDNYIQNLKKEKFGYFPYPIKWIDDRWLMNYENSKIPLGSEILSINGMSITEVISKLYKYYTTDGTNTTGKRIGVRKHFSKFYRFHFGQQEEFIISFKNSKTNLIEEKTLKSVSYFKYYQNFENRYSRPFDQFYYSEIQKDQKYTYERVDSLTGILTINTFAMGNESSEEHKNYSSFLDSIFTKIKIEKLENLIIDVRENGGGTDPNDLITYSYLTQRKFQENKQGWISFKKLPFVRHIVINIPKLIRPFVAWIYNKRLQKEFYLERSKSYYQGPLSNDHKIRTPHKNAFTGTIYLMISPAVASAGSLFAAMMAGNKNTMVIGEETMGGYYGHNGHTPLAYRLPKSGIETLFSIVNLEQDVPKKSNQIYDRGIIPDYKISQSYKDFLIHKDTQMEFTLDLVKRSSRRK